MFKQISITVLAVISSVWLCISFSNFFYGYQAIISSIGAAACSAILACILAWTDSHEFWVHRFRFLAKVLIGMGVQSLTAIFIVLCMNDGDIAPRVVPTVLPIAVPLAFLIGAIAFSPSLAPKPIRQTE